MRCLFALLPILLAGPLTAAHCHLRVAMPAYFNKTVVLYRVLDHVTDRREVLQVIPEPGDTAVFDVEVDGVTKAVLRIGPVSAGLFLVPGADYVVEFPSPETNTARTIGGGTTVDLIFHGLDILDVNALVSDLNTRLDAFLAEGLATDEDAGMNAARDLRSLPKDSVRGKEAPVGLTVMPAPSPQRVDTFEMKLRKFYAEVKDPWFQHYLDFSIAGLRFGPRTDARTLFDRYINGKPVHYDDPEQIRFLQNFFGEHLMNAVFRTHDERLRAIVKAGARDSLDLLFSGHPFLAGDASLRELVMAMELYAHYHDPTFDKAGIQAILEAVRDRSNAQPHRLIADDMLWDLLWMRNGSTFPPLTLRGLDGSSVELTDRLSGAGCVAVTAGWCTWCEVELEALEKLRADYGSVVTFTVISMDSTWEAFTRHARADPARDWSWYWAGDDPLFMDKLRLRAVPAFYLLNGNTIAQSPAPLPSNGMAAILHKVKVEAEEKNRIRYGSEPPPPRR